jgi:hypothetical protein
MLLSSVRSSVAFSAHVEGRILDGKKIAQQLRDVLVETGLIGADDGAAELGIPRLDVAAEKITLRAERGGRRLGIAHDQKSHHIAQCRHMILRFMTIAAPRNPHLREIFAQ